jgi:ribosomal protein L7/L12
MIHTRHAATLIAVLTFSLVSSADAQRGGGGGGSGRERPRQTDANYGAMLRESAIALRLSNGDVEDMDGVKLLIDKKKDLKLSDAQLTQLKAIEEKTKEANKPHFKMLDSLRQAMRFRAGADSLAERARTGMAREAVNGVVKTIRDSYDAALKEAMPIIEESQKPKADELLKKLAEETDETLREKLGGRGGGFGGGGRRGGPPPQ